jgi:DNA recombination protein RmuC
MPELLLPVLGLLALLGLGALAVLAWRLRRDATAEAAGGQLREALERIERELRDELGRQGQASRADLASLQQLLLAQVSQATRTHNEQIDTLRTQVALTQAGVAQSLTQATQALSQQGQAAREAQDAALRAFSTEMAARLQGLAEGNRQQLTEVREGVQSRLVALQEGNERKLEQMRATVDEKLHATLEQRLGESFRQVAERLEQVHKGLGEMQGLARDVGSLNRVLTNVKTRGIFGEVQLAALLEQVFTPEQYGANVETVPGSGARVEFAVRLPGRGDAGSPVWLPIDAKFPREDYERLLDAQERADPAGVEAASRALETRLNAEARTIREKYLAAPHTTDFAILFLPTESLYAEALRRPGLVQALQRDHRVALTGPTTLLATLSSLQMGFRTLALEKRSAEVWQVLGAVKTEFAKFGEVLAKTRKKLAEAASTIDAAEVRTRAMTRQLRAVEALPETQAATLLPGLADAGASVDEADAPGDALAERAPGA